MGHGAGGTAGRNEPAGKRTGERVRHNGAADADGAGLYVYVRRARKYAGSEEPEGGSRVYEIGTSQLQTKESSKMVDLQAYLEKKLRDIILEWNEGDIYAISFFVCANEGYEYNGYLNVAQFSVSYNTENDCNGAGEISEERWNYAFWRQDETPIIKADKGNEGIKILFDWYKENGINNGGYEDYNACYDDEMRYIGKGPVGYYELLSEITAVAKKLQDSGFITNKFGRPIPIIIHDMEYPWYIMEATQKANSHGEADMFFAAMKKLGFMD